MIILMWDYVSLVSQVLGLFLVILFFPFDLLWGTHTHNV